MTRTEITWTEKCHSLHTQKQFNILQHNGNCIHHLLQHSKFLCFAHRLCEVFYYSKNKQRFSNAELTNGDLCWSDGVFVELRTEILNIFMISMFQNIFVLYFNVSMCYMNFN